MDEARVYRKTATGQIEVAARSGSLSLTTRRVLILVDGKRSIAELAPLLRPGEIESAIDTLVEKGYIEPVGTADTASVSSAAAPTVSPGPRTLSEVSDPSRFMSIDEAKRRAVRALTERLGPGADYIALKIEQCRGVDELRARLLDAERALVSALGERAAQEFRQALRRR
ncbi:MAG: hypothetical protein ACM3PU_18520 [Gemmatimonadota bacterium]